MTDSPRVRVRGHSRSQWTQLINESHGKGSSSRELNTSSASFHLRLSSNHTHVNSCLYVQRPAVNTVDTAGLSEQIIRSRPSLAFTKTTVVSLKKSRKRKKKANTAFATRTGVRLTGFHSAKGNGKISFRP